MTNPKIAASARSMHISEKLKLAITATANDTDLGGKDIDIKYSKQLTMLGSFVMSTVGMGLHNYISHGSTYWESLHKQVQI